MMKVPLQAPPLVLCRRLLKQDCERTTGPQSDRGVLKHALPINMLEFYRLLIKNG